MQAPVTVRLMSSIDFDSKDLKHLKYNRTPRILYNINLKIYLSLRKRPSNKPNACSITTRVELNRLLNNFSLSVNIWVALKGTNIFSSNGKAESPSR